MSEKIHGVVEIVVMDRDPATGKPYLKVSLGGVHFNITTNAAEMLGGAAAGVRKRFEDGDFATKN